MLKNSRLAIKQDDDLDAAIDQACQEDKCSKTLVVANALRKGLGLSGSMEERPIAEGRGHKQDYTIKVDATGPISRVTGLIDNGKEYKYCEKCKLFYRYDDNGKPEFWNQ